MIRDAIEGYVETLMAHGEEVPTDEDIIASASSTPDLRMTKATIFSPKTIIWLAYDCGLGDIGVADSCGLDLCVGDPMSGNLQHIVDPALDPPVAVLVPGGLVFS